MKIITSKQEMGLWSLEEQRHGRAITLVPTMGYFHKGHLALMKMGKRLGDRLVVSLFVNPTQFGPSEDYRQYPRDLDRDARLAESEGVDILFCPSPEEMYPEGFQTWVNVELLTQGLCGAKRPGHFKGVATVVLKLFNIVRPQDAVFGQKDFQQLKVIERMVQDLDVPVRIHGHPIVREPDGLAMSSRNTYLSEKERESALCLYRSLELARRMKKMGETRVDAVKKEIRATINSTPFARLDYCFIGDPETLSEQETMGPETLVALAVWIGDTRLIDNAII